MSTRHRPFADVVDLRSPERREADRPRAAAQAAVLRRRAERERVAPSATAQVTATGTPDGIGRLQARRGVRAGAPVPLPTRDVVQFEVVPTAAGGRTPVAIGQVVGRRGAAPAPPGGSFAVDDRLAADCPELAARLVAYTGTAPTSEEWSRDLAAAPGLAPVAVAVLHVVIKSTRPLPTAVTGTSPVAAAQTVGNPVVVAVVDTGISPEVRRDGWLSDITRGPATDPLDAFPRPAGNDRLDLGAGHGTFVAGIIRQVDPRAEIRMYRAMDSDGVGTEIAVACAMVQAAKDGAEVINLSLGGNTIDGRPSLVYEAALDAIDEVSAGRPGRPVVVAAAGNAGDREPVWPAASTRVIAVAGLTAAGDGAPWSSRGPWVNVSTIGEGVVSTYVPGTAEDADTDADGDIDAADENPLRFGPSSWAMWTGTSFAAAQITGAISRRCRQDAVTPQAAADLLIAAGDEVDADFGRGLEILPGT